MKVLTLEQVRAIRQAIARDRGEELRAERRKAVARMGGQARAQKASGYEERRAAYFDMMYGTNRRKLG